MKSVQVHHPFLFELVRAQSLQTARAVGAVVARASAAQTFTKTSTVTTIAFFGNMPGMSGSAADYGHFFTFGRARMIDDGRFIVVTP